MTEPLTSTKVLLVPYPRPGEAPAPVPLRRFRIARVRLPAGDVQSRRRFDHLRRTYD